MDLLTSIGFSIIVAAVLAFLARRLDQPLILGYILAGAVLGPHIGFHVVTDEASIELIAEIGLILLLFLIGLEISLPRLLQAGRAITVTGLLQVPICAGLAWLALGPVVGSMGGQFDRLYLAFASALSSTLIVVKLLSDKFELGTFGGRVTLGVLIFQDLYAIAFLAIQPNLQNLQAMLLLRSLVAGVGLVGGAWVMARFVLPWYFRVIAKSSELVVVSAMAWCFLVAGVAGWAGLSKEMGALIAGVVIASYPYGTEVISRVGGVRDFFLTLFFVALGLKIPEPSTSAVLAALGGVVFVTLSRFLAMYPLFAFLRLDTRTAGVVAINLAQISEFALVIFSLGTVYKHISPAANSLILYTVLLTAVISTYGILYNHAIATWMAGVLNALGLRRSFGGEARRAGERGAGRRLGRGRRGARRVPPGGVARGARVRPACLAHRAGPEGPDGGDRLQPRDAGAPPHGGRRQPLRGHLEHGHARARGDRAGRDRDLGDLGLVPQGHEQPADPASGALDRAQGARHRDRRHARGRPGALRRGRRLRDGAVGAERRAPRRHPGGPLAQRPGPGPAGAGVRPLPALTVDARPARPD